MANENKDILRIETTKLAMPSALRNNQTGYCSDTFEIAHKFNDGTMKYYTTDDVTVILASQATYSNAYFPAVTNVKEALDAIIATLP